MLMHLFEMQDRNNLSFQEAPRYSPRNRYPSTSGNSETDIRNRMSNLEAVLNSFSLDISPTAEQTITNTNPAETPVSSSQTPTGEPLTSPKALGWALLNSRQRARRPPPTTTSAPPNTEWAESHRQHFKSLLQHVQFSPVRERYLTRIGQVAEAVGGQDERSPSPHPVPAPYSLWGPLPKLLYSSKQEGRSSGSKADQPEKDESMQRKEDSSPDERGSASP